MSRFFDRVKEKYELSEFEKAQGKRLIGRSYQKHFENYEEEVYVKKNGKTGVRRVYKGMYYRQELSRSSYVLLRFAYVLCLLMAVLLFSVGATLRQKSNFALLIVLAQSVTGLLLLWTFVVLLIYLITPKKMTKGDYHAGSRALCKAAGNAAIGMACTFALTVLYDLAHFSELIYEDYLCAFCFGAGALLVFGIRLLENRIPYTVFSQEDGKKKEA